jgi:hypothetical protein
MKQISVRPVIIFIIISIASAFQTFIYVIRTPAGFVYPLVHNYEQDYYWYLSLMRQGWDGHLALTSKFTPEVFPRILVSTLFPLFGMIAHVIGMNLPLMYLVMRIMFGAGLLTAGYFLLKETKVKREIVITGVLFMIFGSPFWYMDKGIIRLVGEFWTGFDPILRVSFLPHHLIANIFVIASLVFIARSVENHSVKYALVAGILSMVACLTNFAGMVILALAIGVGCVVFSLQKRKRWILEICIWAGLCVFPIIYLYYVQNSTFPWTGYRDWERFVQYPLSVMGYIGVIGAVGIVGMVGVWFAIQKKSFLWNCIIGWFMAPFIGLFLVQFFPLSNGRVLQGAGYIPSALLAGLAMWEIGGLSKRIRYILVALLILFQIPALVSSVDRQMSYIDKNMTNTYVMVSKDTWDTVEWLSSHATEGIIIAPSDVSPIIAGLTPLRTFTGHPTLTFEVRKKDADLNEFYYGTVMDFKSILLDVWRLTYIWIPKWGPQEVFEKQGYSKVYENPSAILYQRVVGR